MRVQVYVKRSNGEKLTMDAELDGTVLSFKEELEKATQVAPSLQRLIYKGKVLKDDMTLAFYQVEAEQTLYFVKGANKPTAPATPAAPAAPVAAPSIPTPPVAPLPTPFGANPFGSTAAPLSNPFGNGAGFGLPPPNVQSMMQNPEMMQQMMESPMVQSMLNNPELMRSMMQSNPAMRSLLEQNPELNHAMNDPELLRRSMEAMRNPAAMREMMRSQDTAMRNIESLPGGFNALRRMYTEVQEPLMNAASSGNGIGANNPAFPMPGAVGGAPTSTNSTPASTTPNPATFSAPANPWANLGGANPAASSNPPANPWAAGGQGGFGGGMDMSAMLNNPMVQTMMQQMSQNPEMLRSMMEMNPQFQQLDPASREMMLNPEVMRTMMNPSNLQAIMQMQQAMNQLQSSGALPPGAFPGAFPGANPGAAPGGFGGFPGMFGTPPPSTPAQNPEELYASQLTQLNDMGFSNREQNLRALQATYGNVNAAVDRILSGLS